MKLVSNIETWADAHHPKWLDIVRVFLGLVLIAKGISFLGNTELFVTMLKNSTVEFLSITIAHYVIIAHLMGGILIAIGLLTRIAVLFQIPILIGAIIFVNFSKGFFAINSDLPFSVLVLTLLIFFLIYGSGPWSVDNYIQKHISDE
jgi:putative oxidoreductase